jgi:exosortase C (VPDSG-CTERM-specific)
MQSAAKDKKRNLSHPLWLSVGSLIVLGALFLRPLVDLANYAAANDRYSYVFLVPIISAYFIWNKKGLKDWGYKHAHGKIYFITSIGTFSLLGYLAFYLYGLDLSHNDYLSLTIFSFICYLLAIALIAFGEAAVKKHCFSVCFLFLLVPIPSYVVGVFEVFLQYASAEATDWLLTISGTSCFRQGMVFEMPGLSLEIARECSGIDSTFVLVVVSIVAGRMLLKKTWSRIALTVLAVPLGILRNGMRVFTLAMLTLHVDPGTIDGPIHHQGGPMFFAISLAPLFGLAMLLRRLERERT